MAVKSSLKTKASEAQVSPHIEKNTRSSKTRSTTSRTRKTIVAGEAQSSASAVATLAHAVATEQVPGPQEEIARLAYCYWQQRGCPHGDSMQDWLRAEREVLTRFQEQPVSVASR